MHATGPPPTSIGRVWGCLRYDARNLVRKPPGIPNLARRRRALDIAISLGRPQRQAKSAPLVRFDPLCACQEQLGILVAVQHLFTIQNGDSLLQVLLRWTLATAIPMAAGRVLPPRSSESVPQTRGTHLAALAACQSNPPASYHHKGQQSTAGGGSNASCCVAGR